MKGGVIALATTEMLPGPTYKDILLHLDRRASITWHTMIKYRSQSHQLDDAPVPTDSSQPAVASLYLPPTVCFMLTVPPVEHGGRTAKGTERYRSSLSLSLLGHFQPGIDLNALRRM